MIVVTLFQKKRLKKKIKKLEQEVTTLKEINDTSARKIKFQQTLIERYSNTSQQNTDAIHQLKEKLVDIKRKALENSEHLNQTIHGLQKENCEHTALHQHYEMSYTKTDEYNNMVRKFTSYYNAYHQLKDISDSLVRENNQFRLE
ncbi:MAG: hypothetical protein HC770_10400, partial [Pseudanabaena sp. CRU_2_10]|nr:hypothetical protein [Pseudanabaena sp. CRU_2_10]